MAKVHDFVLGQRPDALMATGGENDVPGRVLVAQAELAQGAESSPYDAAPQQPRGDGGIGDMTVAAVALGVDEVLDQPGPDVADQQRASHGGVPAESPEQQAELVEGLDGHFVMSGHVLPDLEYTVDAVREGEVSSHDERPPMGGTGQTGCSAPIRRRVRRTICCVPYMQHIEHG